MMIVKQVGGYKKHSGQRHKNSADKGDVSLGKVNPPALLALRLGVEPGILFSVPWGIRSWWLESVAQTARSYAEARVSL